VINVNSPEWKAIVQECINERELLREALETFVENEGQRDRTDFIRGRIFELTNIINRKEFRNAQE
jgi:hypothetical protein